MQECCNQYVLTFQQGHETKVCAWKVYSHETTTMTARLPHQVWGQEAGVWFCFVVHVTQHERPVTCSWSSRVLLGYSTDSACAGLVLWSRVEWKSTCSEWVHASGLCNVYLREAVDTTSEGRVSDQSRPFVLVGWGSVEIFPGVKEREYSPLFL